MASHDMIKRQCGFITRKEGVLFYDRRKKGSGPDTGTRREQGH